MKKILVANRGEIALRIMRSAKEMGIKTVAIFSDADRTAPHVRFADEAVNIGPPPSDQSYLNGQKIIEAARELSADGIHPGYGFLSENATFAKQVGDAGIKFIGPRPHSIEVMGNKLVAKETVLGYDIPMVPGTDKAITDVEEAKATAIEIGFPVLLKAAAGGGGKGMRVVNEEKEFAGQMERAVSEAKSAFGDGSVFIEKYVTKPRHIEVQILADEHGNVVHLFERECSIQRRHQKVIEEAPSSLLDENMRKKIGQSAVDVAKACQYAGAGTVEFLMDADLNFYFLEMNTRLQVEHPVTEMITGIDLVKEQIKIARGEKLSFQQEELSINGHAIELRVYAEDPANNFLPDIGKLERYKKPDGPGVRVDDGFEESMDIPIFYDPMIAKLVTWGKNRKESIDRMKRAIREYQVKGVKNTLSFGAFVMDHPEFVKGNLTTHFIQNYFSPADLTKTTEQDAKIAAAIATRIMESSTQEASTNAQQNAGYSRWKANRLQNRE